MRITNQRRFLSSCFAGVCLTFSASCSLILDFDESIATPIDGSTVDAATIAIDSIVVQPDSRNCASLDPSSLEPNDIPLQATPLVGMIDSVICSAGAERDIDVFTFSVSGLEDAVIELRPNPLATGNLDIRLLDAGNTVIIQATNPDAASIEKLSLTTANFNRLPPGTYFVEVFPDTAATTETYTISLVLGSTK